MVRGLCLEIGFQQESPEVEGEEGVLPGWRRLQRQGFPAKRALVRSCLKLSPSPLEIYLIFVFLLPPDPPTPALSLSLIFLSLPTFPFPFYLYAFTVPVAPLRIY